jgi:hypothetical protein
VLFPVSSALRAANWLTRRAQAARVEEGGGFEVGLLLDPETAFKLLDLGPASDQAEAVRVVLSRSPPLSPSVPRRRLG